MADFSAWVSAGSDCVHFSVDGDFGQASALTVLMRGEFEVLRASIAKPVEDDADAASSVYVSRRCGETGLVVVLAGGEDFIGLDEDSLLALRGVCDQVEARLSGGSVPTDSPVNVEDADSSVDDEASVYTSVDGESVDPLSSLLDASRSVGGVPCR